MMHILCPFQIRWEEYLLVAQSLRAGSLWPDRSRRTSQNTHQRAHQRNCPHRCVLWLHTINTYITYNLALVLKEVFENCLSITKKQDNHIHTCILLSHLCMLQLGKIQCSITNQTLTFFYFSQDADSFSVVINIFRYKCNRQSLY